MKRPFYLLSMLLFFCSMLFFPKQVFEGASSGLLLWFQIVLPTLLPFVILSNLLVNTNAVFVISKVTGPILQKIFHVSKPGSFAVLVGFLCGYPMGAKVTGDLLRKQYITDDEGRYLLSFCNNTSPMFITSYVIWQNLKQTEDTIIILFILLLSPLLVSFLFRKRYLRNAIQGTAPHLKQRRFHFEFQILDESIMNAFETITKIGGYIILFSIVISLLTMLPLNHPAFTLGFLPSLEITNGIPMLCSLCSNSSIRLLLVMALTSFGGFCALAQTKCMLYGTAVSIYPYLIQKLVTAAATSLLTLIYICCK